MPHTSRRIASASWSLAHPSPRRRRRRPRRSADDLRAPVRRHARAPRHGARPGHRGRGRDGWRRARRALAPTGEDTPSAAFSRAAARHASRRLRGSDVAVALEQLTAAGAELIDERPRSGSSAWRSRSCVPTPPTASSRRWLPVADTESVRIEVGFDGGQIASALVTAEGAEAVRACSARGRAAAHRPGRQRRPSTIVLRRVVYLKRFARAQGRLRL